MSDPRLNGAHLNVGRRDQYDATVDEMLDDRGPATAAADPLVREPSLAPEPMLDEPPPVGGTYTLVSLVDGRRHSLRVGINAIGRLLENDLVLQPNSISRRHCVVVVHATGGCEVFDTASRNGTYVNRRRVGRIGLRPGDVLTLCWQHFQLAWADSDEEMPRAAPESNTTFPSGLSTAG
jgi:pSer/pThr/pTyr-binding forkhead associated (FHA) protein